MGKNSLGISVEQVIEIKFRSYLDTLEPEERSVYLSSMVEAAGDSITTQIEDVGSQFSSLMKQIPAFTSALTTEMGSAAAIAANTANPFAVTASPGMIISLLSSIQGLISTFNGIKSSYDSLLASVSKLMPLASVPALEPLISLMSGMEDPEENSPPVPPQPKFEVIVEFGSGGGSYADGEVVELSAFPLSGFVFVRWVSDNADIKIEDAEAEDTSFKMIIVSSAITVTATYKELPTP